MWLNSILLSALAGAAVASPLASTGNTNDARAAALTLCDANCMAQYNAALDREKKRWVTANFADDHFYDTPANATGARPGDLISWQDIDVKTLANNFTGIPGGMSVSRFLYMTEDMQRNPIIASAFVLLPFSAQTTNDQNETVFRTLAWAHGTTGNARQCAPSNYQNLNYGWQAPIFFAASGYAVIAPDYSGMGSASPNGFQYEAGHIHAADVAYSVVAARKMIGHLLTEEWVVAGHSEGGMTAWRTNERLAMPDQQELLKAGTFLGAMSASPALRPYDLIPKSFLDTTVGGPINAVYVMQSVGRLYPSLSVNEWLTPAAKELIPLLDASCLETGAVLFQNLTATDIFVNTTWTTTPEFKDWQVRVNGAGPDGQPFTLAAPMLVVQGLNDTLTYAPNLLADFNATCKSHGQTISAELALVPDLGHDASFYAGNVYLMSWIESLFNGKKPQTGCTTTNLNPTAKSFQHAYNG